MPPCASGDAAIAGLVAQMLQTTATLTVMVDEMMRFRAAGHSAPDAPPVIEVLGRLLCDVLPALLADHPPARSSRHRRPARRRHDHVPRPLLRLAGRDAMPASRHPTPRNPAAADMSRRGGVARGGTLGAGTSKPRIQVTVDDELAQALARIDPAPASKAATGPRASSPRSSSVEPASARRCGLLKIADWHCGATT